MEYNVIINELINYGIVNNLCEEIDAIYLGNRIIDILKLNSFKRDAMNENVRPLDAILFDLQEIAINNNVISGKLLERDHFDTPYIRACIPFSRRGTTPHR